tara:strand:+ start:2006 stop:2578 length:573 start_codon:yes stop_codon:yes gene_type:complete
MLIKKNFLKNFLIIIIFIKSLFFIPELKSAEEIKIIYSIFSRTIEIESLKKYAASGNAKKNLKRLLKRIDSNDDEILKTLNKSFDIPLPIASKLMYSDIGNVVLTRLSKIIHTPNARDEKTGILALRSSIIKGIVIGNGKINLVNFFEGYPTKTVILNINALSKILNKVESINELLKFFTDSPLNKIKEN